MELCLYIPSYGSRNQFISSKQAEKSDEASVDLFEYFKFWYNNFFLRTCDKNVFTYLPKIVRHDSFGKKKELLLFTCLLVFSSLSLFLFFRANLLRERVFVFLFSRGWPWSFTREDQDIIETLLC